MKLKYYMRGLGIGIILTTLILVICGNKEKLSNEEIKSRAMKLGMVMEEQPKDSLEEVLDSNQELTSIPEPTTSQALSITPEPTKLPEPSKTPEPTKAPEPTSTPEPTRAPEPTQISIPTETAQNITFTIKSGMSSGKVSDLLYQNGLVDDANTFNEFIVQAGKADVIRVGTFTLPVGASYDEILGMIASY